MSIKVIIKYNNTEGIMSEGQVAMFPSGKKMLSDIVVKVEEESVFIPDDLTGYTVTVPANWTATAGYGLFKVTLDNGLDETFLGIGYTGDPSGNMQISPTANQITSMDSLYIPLESYGYGQTSFAISFYGGTDATNQDLIQWFKNVNATFTKTENKDEVVLKTLSFLQTSTWSSYPIERQYEEGMTWEQFINSDYNAIQTDPYYDRYIRGQFINQDGYVKFYGIADEELDYKTLDVLYNYTQVKITDVIEGPYNSMYAGDGGGNN